MQVKITSGIYGYRRQGSAFVTPKYAGDVADVPPEEALRLEKLGVAVLVEGASEAPPVPRPSEEKELLAMTRQELEQLAEEAGVDVSHCKNKGEIAKALAGQELEPAAQEEGPALGAEEPVA